MRNGSDLLQNNHGISGVKKKYFLIVFLSFLFAGGCARGLVPKPDQTGDVDLRSSIVTKKIGGASVSVQTQEWHFVPSELDQFYTPVLFLIKNSTENKISFSLKSLYLIGDSGNQFQPTPPSEVEKTFIDRGYIFTPSAHIGIGSGGYSSFFGLGLDFPLYPPPPAGSDISLLAIQEGEILPGAVIRGFAYFKQTSFAGGEMTLHVEMNQASDDFYFLVKK
ncbi:MAG: hypothetical protein HY202_07355 [Nitrospirae bacterium]|nr:hypothetical protein [Nitrospirota bacterium]